MEQIQNVFLSTCAQIAKHAFLAEDTCVPAKGTNTCVRLHEQNTELETSRSAIQDVPGAGYFAKVVILENHKIDLATVNVGGC